MTCELPPEHCSHCGEIIGVYERLVIVRPDGGTEEGARAADRGILDRGKPYHHACFQDAADSGSPTSLT